MFLVNRFPRVWVTSIYLVSSLAQPGQNVFVCRPFKVNSRLTLSFLRGPECWQCVMESSIQGVKIIVLHMLASHSFLFDHFYVDNWDSWHVQHCSRAAASTTHSHPSHSGGNILINTENILSLSVCLYLYLLAPHYLSTHHKGRISLYVTVNSLVYCPWSPMTGSECVDCHLTGQALNSQSYHDPQVALIANLLDMTSLDSQ